MTPKQKADVPLPRVPATNEGTSKELFPWCFSTSVLGATARSAWSGENGVPVLTGCPWSHVVSAVSASVGALHVVRGQEGTGRGTEAVPEGRGCKARAIGQRPSQSSAQASGLAGRGGERGEEEHSGGLWGEGVRRSNDKVRGVGWKRTQASEGNTGIPSLPQHTTPPDRSLVRWVGLAS